MTQAQFNGALAAVAKHKNQHLQDLLFIARAAQADAKGYKAALKLLNNA